MGRVAATIAVLGLLVTGNVYVLGANTVREDYGDTALLVALLAPLPVALVIL
jgi:hypothetical protein